MRKTILSILVALGLFVAPAVSLAQVPFGGFDVSILFACTSPAGYTLNIFAPLFYGSTAPIAGWLLSPPVVGFENFGVHPVQWDLGFLIPGGVCVIGVCPYCVSIPALGTVTPFTGVSP